jgi:peroxiredoxin
LPEIEAFGASLLAISPQKPDDALTAKEKNELDFEVLSDSDQKVIKAFNLQFDPGQDYHNRRDLTLLNGDGSKTIPVPATFIIKTNGTIAAAHVEANYTQRMGASEILDILKVLSKMD